MPSKNERIQMRFFVMTQICTGAEISVRWRGLSMSKFSIFLSDFRIFGDFCLNFEFFNYVFSIDQLAE